MTDNIHIHRLRVAIEKEHRPKDQIFVRLEDLKYVLDRLDHLQQAIEDFEPLHAGDAEWKDEVLS